MRRKRNQNKIISILLLGILGSLFVALPAIAQATSNILEGRDILVSTSENILSIESWWDRLWDSTFNPPTIQTSSVASVDGVEINNLSIYAFVNPVRFILAIGLTFWLFDFGTKMYESKGGVPGIIVFTKLFLPVLLAILFLSNQANYSRVLAFGLREIINSWSNGVMELQILDISVRGAIQDKLVTEDAKQEILEQLQICQALPQPEVSIPTLERPDTITLIETNTSLTTEQRQVYDYLECLKEISEFAQNKIDSPRECRGGCKTLERFLDVVYDVITNEAEVEFQRRVSDGRVDRPRLTREQFTSLLTQPGKSILYFTQWMTASGLEMALFLLGLFAPIFIAAALIPNRQNLFNVWLIETLTIGLAKLAYVIIIGLVAVQSVSVENTLGSFDKTFFLTLGIFAPAVSFAVVTVGAVAAAASYRNQTIGAVAVAISVTSGIISTAAFGIARRADKNR